MWLLEKKRKKTVFLFFIVPGVLYNYTICAKMIQFYYICALNTLTITYAIFLTGPRIIVLAFFNFFFKK